MSDSKNMEGFAFEWDAEIENDGQETILLTGDYTFIVDKVERGSYPGSQKIPPCNKVTLTLRVNTDEGKVALVWTDLILYSSLEWKLASFFRSIGLKKHGEKLKMNWSAVEGAVGKATFKPRTYTNSKGEKHTVNNVVRYLDEDAENVESDVNLTAPPAPKEW